MERGELSPLSLCQMFGHSLHYLVYKEVRAQHDAASPTGKSQVPIRGSRTRFEDPQKKKLNLSEIRIEDQSKTHG